MALVRERHSAVRQAFDALLDAYAIGDQQRIIAANETFRTALHQLEAVVAAEHWPDWLKDLVLNADRYSKRHNNGLATWRAHLEAVINNADHLKNENWTFSETESIIFDADVIVEKARQDNKIDLLYDRIIECLQKIIGCGEIDSVRASGDLDRLISTLRNARDGTFYSQVINWDFAKQLITNIISSYLKRNPITGPLIEGLEKTAEELDVSLAKAKDQIGAGIIYAASSVLRSDVELLMPQNHIISIGHHISQESMDGAIESTDKR